MAGWEISLAGAGKVSEALCFNLSEKGHHIRQIVSPHSAEGKALASKFGAGWSDKPIFDKRNQIILIAVPDMKLREVLDTISCNRETVVAHTAGSFGLEVFPERMINVGVFYPLQTFSKNRKTNLKGVPVFIESSAETAGKMLHSLAKSLECSVYESDTEHRRLLHVAAVFVSNFTNYMLTSGKEISDKSGFPLEVLKPLISETIAKAFESGPEKSQTGPAVRYDLNTIEKHLELLSFSPELKKIYNEITNSIIEHYKQRSGNE